MILNYFMRRTSKININCSLALLCVYMLISTVLLIMMGGCGTERDPTFVDFSKRVALERPGDMQPDRSYFKVAVGSMISAQETAAYYQDLLGFIAGKQIQNPVAEEKLPPQLLSGSNVNGWQIDTDLSEDIEDFKDF